MSSRLPPAPPMPTLVPMPAIASDTQTSVLSDRVRLALLLGVPIVVGSGLFIYFRYYHKTDQTDGKKSGKEANQTKVKRVVETETVIDDPFKRAMNFKTKGNKYFKACRYDEAIDCYTKAIEECPKDKTTDLSTFYQNRAACYDALHKYQEVIADCTKAIELNNRYIKALVRRAKALEAVGDLNGALFDITAVCILEQFQNQANLLTTDRLLRHQSKVKAKELFKKRTPRLPSEHFISHYFMSYSKDPILKACEPNKIVEHLETLRAKQEESGEVLADYLLLNGTLEILKGNIEGGEKELEQLVKLNNCEPDIKVNALIKLGTIKVQDIGREDSFKTALECFDQAIQLDANNPDIYLHRAQIHLLSEKVDDAYKDLEKCCKLNDDFASALAQKFYVQFRCGVRYNDESTVAKALKGFENATQKFPQSSEVFSLYAQALMETGDFQKADEFFGKAIEKDPVDGNLYVHRGILYLQSNNDIDKAVKLLEEAMKVDPNCQFAYEMLGSIQVQKGQLEEGIKRFDKALELAQTELDCAHLFSLRDAAEAQQKATKLLGIELPAV